MTKHVSYRGITIDMDSMRRENEKSVAVGNMGVNAKGDQIKGGQVTKTADQIARENHRVQSTIVKTGLKGPIPAAPAIPEALKKVTAKPVKPTVKTKEIEMPNGDIIVGDDTTS